MRRIYFAIILVVAGPMLGTCFANSLDCWLPAVGSGIIGVCVLLRVVSTVQQFRRNRRRELLGRADRFEEERVRAFGAAQLRQFWESETGRWVSQNPFLANESVRILPINQVHRPRITYGVLTEPIDDAYVAQVELVPPKHVSRWQQYVRTVSKWVSFLR